MVNLQNTPSAGPLTAAGAVLPLHRATFVDTVPVQAAEACTELGAESMLRHRRTAAHTRSIALALLLAVAGYLAHITWPLA
jgi:hypothetical protein